MTLRIIAEEDCEFCGGTGFKKSKDAVKRYTCERCMGSGKRRSAVPLSTLVDLVQKEMRKNG